MIFAAEVFVVLMTGIEARLPQFLRFGPSACPAFGILI
jgi:hypothetical protein